MTDQAMLDQAFDEMILNTESVAKEATQSIFGGIFGFIGDFFQEVWYAARYLLILFAVVCILYYIHCKRFERKKRKDIGRYRCKDPSFYPIGYILFHTEEEWEMKKRKEVEEFNVWARANNAPEIDFDKEFKRT